MLTPLVRYAANPYENITMESGTADNPNGGATTNPELDLNLQTSTYHNYFRQFIEPHL